MEAGSLLQEALSRQTEYDIFGSDHAVWLDVYLLRSKKKNASQHHRKTNTKTTTPEDLLELAQLASELNVYFQAQTYYWHIGGDGPIFGIHVTDQVPHLRAICCYGANIADEWLAVQFLQNFTFDKPHIAAEVFDVQDGQILLIESADILPHWVDQISPEACRHRCWIRQGKIHLIQPNNVQTNDIALHDYSLGLSEALELLEGSTKESSSSNAVVAPDNVQQAIHQCISRLTTTTTNISEADSTSKSSNSQQMPNCHKAAVSVPRSVANLIRHRPDLVNAAIVAFANLAHEPPSPLKKKGKNNQPSNEPGNASACEDWVWTTHSFSRTNFAMLRTIVSPSWNTEDFIPQKHKSVELKRIQRQCNVEATPHLRHALQLGVRLVAGFEALLLQQQLSSPSVQSSPLSLKEQRVLQWWSRISQQVNIPPQWLEEAWRAGPNRAPFNMEPILQCPVFLEELERDPHNSSITLYSHPETPVKQQIVKELKREHPNASFVLPRQDEVDSNEDWMTLSMEHVDEQMKSLRGGDKVEEGGTKAAEEEEKQQSAQMDSMLESFETFMTDKSDVGGVTHNNIQQSTDTGVSINPRVFLHLLQNVLDPSTTPESIPVPPTQQQPNGTSSDDKYFSKEDYDDMLPNDDDDDDDSGDDENNGQIDTDVVELMRAMDQELKGSAAMQDDGINILKEDGMNVAEDAGMEEGARILTNLLQSLDAGSGGPGPVQSMIRALGKEPPLMSSDALGEDDDDESS